MEPRTTVTVLLNCARSSCNRSYLPRTIRCVCSQSVICLLEILNLH